MKTMNDLNGLVKKVFPGGKRYPEGTMTPSVISLDGGLSYLVSLLLICDKDTIDTISDNNGTSTIEISAYLSDGYKNHSQNLHFSIKFMLENDKENPGFEMVVKGDDIEFQKMFVKALREIDNITLWITDSRMKVKKAMNLGFDYNMARWTLDLLV